MKMTWLGQAGYFLCTDSGTKIFIDPYMSNNLEEVKGASFHREVPIDDSFYTIQPDVIILTHIHDDHTDFATLDRIFAGATKPISVLAPLNTWAEVRKRYGGIHEYMQFDEGIEVTLGDAFFKSVYAAHSDERAIGVLIMADGRTIYHTGDTMFHRRLGEHIDRSIDAMLVPINGKGNNMNFADAVRLTERIKPRKVFPMHWDMFKAYGCNVSCFINKMNSSETKVQIVVPDEYQEVEV